MTNSYVLMEYYIRYLREVRKVSESSIKHYLGAIKSISRYLSEKNIIETSVYEIKDVEEINKIRDFLFCDAEFKALDKRGHQMYSSGLNNYYQFSNGRGFKNIQKEIKAMDIEIPVGELIETTVKEWKRSTIIKTQIFESANYECEINHNHATFTAKSSGKQYMEGHHAIPMNMQDKFSKSLDIYANVICLCPTCHRMLHYGVEDDKKQLLDRIYVERSDRLANCGIKIGKEEFEKLVV